MLIFLPFVVFFDIFIGPRLIGDRNGLEVMISGTTDIWWFCDKIEVFFRLKIYFFGAYT